MRTHRALTAACAVVLVVVAVFLATRDDSPAWRPQPPTVEIITSVTIPSEFIAPAWAELFAQEGWEQDAAVLETTPTDVVDPAGARTEAAQAVSAQLASDPDLRARYASYLADPIRDTSLRQGDPMWRLAGTCTGVGVTAAHPMMIPGSDRYAKAVVVWEAQCASDVEEDTAVGTTDRNRERELRSSFVYLRRDGDTWVAVRESQVPGSAAGFQDSGVSTPPWLRDTMRCNGPLEFTARLEVVEAVDAMCTAARRDGVDLVVTSGWRTELEQKQRYDRAVREVGEDKARAEIAWQGDRCASRHCVGWAVDFGGSASLEWLSRTAGCQSGDGSFSAGAVCGANQRSVTNAQVWGFAQPYPWEPGHLEYVLPPATARWVANCDPMPSSAMPEIISAVWRCRLGEAALSREEVQEATARAVATARCVSGWNAEARFEDGRFAVEPDPRTGAIRDETGLFLLKPSEVARYSDRPATDPVGNADAAVRLYLTERQSGTSGFARWGTCAPSTLPDWSYLW